MRMLTLYVTRHGETEWNIEKRLQGWKNSNLTEKGRRNAILLANRLQNTKFDAIYSSPSERAFQTAEIIKQQRSICIFKDDNLREIHLGEWEGQTLEQLEQQFPHEYFAFWNTPHLYTTETGETFFDIEKRVDAFLRSVVKNHKTGTVLVVSHSVWIKVLLAKCKNLPLKQLWQPPYIHDTSLTIMTISGNDYNMIVEGDISHRE